MLALKEDRFEDALLTKLKIDVELALKTLAHPYTGNIFELYIRGNRHIIQVRYEKYKGDAHTVVYMHSKNNGIKGTSKNIDAFILALALLGDMK